MSSENTDNFETLLEHCLLKNSDEFETRAEYCMKLVMNEDYWKRIHNFTYVDLKNHFTSISDVERLNYFRFGISCFLCFVQANFTGPELSDDIKAFLGTDFFKGVNFVKRLAVNRENINVNTRHPELLVCAEIIFDCCVIHCLVNIWWGFRAIRVHQEILDELSPTLVTNADRFYKLINDSYPLSGHTKARFEIELAQFFLTYNSVARVKKHYDSATDLLGVEFKLNKNKEHYELEVSLDDKTDIIKAKIDDIHVPRNYEQMLDQSDETTITKLPNSEQKLCLIKAQEIYMCTPSDEFRTESIQAFFNMILSQKNTYAVRMTVLYLRCLIDNRHQKTKAECKTQLEELLGFYEKIEPKPLKRMKHLFGSLLVPIWKVEKLYADVLFAQGATQKSLEIYLKLKLWKDTVACYYQLKLNEIIEDVILKQISLMHDCEDNNITETLICLLGEVTGDVKNFELAWIQTKKRSHRVQREWGQFHYKRKEYKEAIPHFEKSLSINPLQSEIWNQLGKAAVYEENWTVAATAYRRYTTMQPEGFAAWNHLAKAYLKNGNKLSAHYAISEALKRNTDNWILWENLLIISSEMSRYPDVIQTYNRILDLKEDDYLNVEVLNSMADDLSSLDPACLKGAQQLLGRLVALYPDNGCVWEVFAALAPQTLLKVHRMQRAFRCYVQDDWDRDIDRCYQVLFLCGKLADIALDESVDNRDVIVNSVKTNMNIALNALKKHDYEETKSLVEEVTAKFDKVYNKMNVAIWQNE